MGLSPKLLGADEHEVLHLRTHPKKLVAPVLWLLLLAVLLGAGLALVPRYLSAPWTDWALGLLALVLLVLFVWQVVLPVLRWLTTTYTFTDRRIISRRGLITRTGHDLPLRRINDVSYARSLTDRLFGCGTLVVTTAAEQPVILSDVSQIEHVHLVMNDLLFDDDALDAGDERLD